MNKADVTVEEITWSINGFDKIAIQMQFGMSLADIQKAGDDVEFARALAFTHMRRQQMSDTDARDAAMNLSIRDLSEYFAEPANEQESGKDSPA